LLFDYTIKDYLVHAYISNSLISHDRALCKQDMACFTSCFKKKQSPANARRATGIEEGKVVFQFSPKNIVSPIPN
jgi:hypothetical protein